MKNGFLKVCTLSPALRVADCAYNTQETIAAMQQAAQDGAASMQDPAPPIGSMDENK